MRQQSLARWYKQGPALLGREIVAVSASLTLTGLSVESQAVDSLPADVVGQSRPAVSTSTVASPTTGCHPSPRGQLTRPTTTPYPAASTELTLALGRRVACVDTILAVSEGSHIFISYSRVDRGYVRSLAVWLTRNGVQVWMDDQVPTSELWEDVLIERISSCRGLLLVMTPEAGASPWVAKEVGLARQLGKPIHPVRLRGEIVLGLEKIQYDDVQAGGFPSAMFLIHLRGMAPLRRVVPNQFGLIPPAAGFFQHREIADDLEADLLASRGVVLTSAASVLSGLGGVGKTQLAAEVARRVVDSGTADIVAWVTATSREAVLTAFAEAGAALVPGADPAEPEKAARMFLTLLGTIAGRWLVVFDDVQDPADLDGLWPPTTPSGQMLATTRRTDDALARRGRFVTIGQFTPPEAMAYLRAAFATHLARLEGAAELAAELGYLPLALSQAAAFINDKATTCADYLGRFRKRQARLAELAPESLPDDYTRSVSVSISLSVEVADQLVPVGMARPLLEILSLLDPNGIPRVLTAASATLAWLREASGSDADAGDALSALTRLSLVTLVEDGAVPLVRMHALVQRAVLDAMPAARLEVVVAHAAAAMAEMWPAIDSDIGAMLRANAEVLWMGAGDLMLHREACVVLVRVGRSLREAGLVTAAIEHCRRLVADAVRVLGPDHPRALDSRNELAHAHQDAGRVDEAIGEFEALMADTLRVLGPDHPQTLASRNDLAFACREGGRVGEAVSLFESVLADRLRVLGSADADTLLSRNNLALAYRSAGRVDESITLFEALLADQVRVLGPDHPDALSTRSHLAYSYRNVGRASVAIALYESVLADRLRVLGPDHPDTLRSRNNLAVAYRDVGRVDEAIALFEALLADRLRVLGPDHPHTLKTRSSLADAYRIAGRTSEAVAMLVAVLTDRERVLGPDHPLTLHTRNFLGVAHQADDQTAEAIATFEAVLADRARVLGPDHPDTLLTRSNLALAYEAAGRLEEAITLLEAVLADRLRVLGPNHPSTESARVTLAAALAAR